MPEKPSETALLTSGLEGSCLSHLGFSQGLRVLTGFLTECALSKAFPGPRNQVALGIREPRRLDSLGKRGTETGALSRDPNPGVVTG